MSEVNANIKISNMQVVGVRFRDRCKIYNCVFIGLDIKKNYYCIIETDDGLAFGQIVKDPEIIDESKTGSFFKIIRIANEDDIKQYNENIQKEKEAYKFCLQKIEEKNLPLRLVEVDYAFDKGKAIFYFTAEKRIDFRDLVKDLAYALKMRIDMRQIGVRDEAKMLGGYGCCGRELCCVAFLRDFIPVTIKMAKNQNLPLNQTKISGMCGRLMCCLGYEHEMYNLAQLEKKISPLSENSLTGFAGGEDKS
ncbi:MAG: regulatory iron-sulfur-containing complex subunit RicT [Candidatus Firestonebacteria bacterium]